MYSDDDESSSEDLDQEARLYTQLYFGNELELCANLKSTANKKIFNNNDQPNKELASQLEIKPYSDIKINEAKKFSINSKNEHENNSVINDTVKRSLSEVKTPASLNTSSKSLAPKKMNKQEKNVSNKKAEVDIANKTKKCKRKRNPSICSVDSISGREPLDNLYCQIVDERLDIIDEDLDESHSDERYSTNRFNNENKLGDDEPGSKISEILRNSHPKEKLQDKVDIKSSDDEICVLPLNQSNLDTVGKSTMEDSDNSVQIINCIKQSKKKRKEKKKKVSRIKQKENCFENICISSVTVSGNGTPSNLTESEDDMTEVSPKTPIVFKFGSQILSTAKKKKLKLKFSKSCVIFSKNRPLTKKTPSCSQWTPEMATFYDSDYSDEFSVEDIHNSQNKNPRLWKICSEDFQGPVRKNRRYFDVRCTRCKEFGHTVDSCPRVPHCLLCASPDHSRFRCPKKCCLFCGQQHSATYCNLASRLNTCSECKQKGHVVSICPDLWRRFHATTSGTIPVVPVAPSIRERKDAYCYNCARKGHFGHECKIRRKPNDDFRVRHTQVSAQVFNYSTRLPIPERKVVDLEEEDGDDGVEVLSPPKRLESDLSVHEQRNEASEVEKAESDIVAKCVALTPDQVKMFIRRQERIKVEIRKLVNSRIKHVILRKEKNKMAIKGPSNAVKCVKAIVFCLLENKLNMEYRLLILRFNEQQNDEMLNSSIYNCKKSKPKVIVKESKYDRSVLSSKSKDIKGKNKNNKNSSAVGNYCPMSKVSIDGLTDKENYLPVPLPYSKKDILVVFKKVLKFMYNKDKEPIVGKTLIYFNENIESLYSDPNFFSNLQRLALIAQSQLKDEGKPCILLALKRLRNKIRILQDDKISPTFHNKIWEEYSKVASPNVKHIQTYLELARKSIDLIEARKTSGNFIGKDSKRRKRLKHPGMSFRRSNEMVKPKKNKKKRKKKNKIPIREKENVS